MISLILIMISVFIYLHLSRQSQFIIFSLAALFPFTLGDFISFKDFQVAEWLTVLVFLILINELVSIKTISKKDNNLNFSGIGIFIFAGVILLILSLLFGYFTFSEYFPKWFSHKASDSNLLNTLFSD